MVNGIRINNNDKYIGCLMIWYGPVMISRKLIPGTGKTVKEDVLISQIDQMPKPIPINSGNNKIFFRITGPESKK